MMGDAAAAEQLDGLPPLHLTLILTRLYTEFWRDQIRMIQHPVLSPPSMTTMIMAQANNHQMMTFLMHRVHLVQWRISRPRQWKYTILARRPWHPRNLPVDIRVPSLDHHIHL